MRHIFLCAICLFPLPCLSQNFNSVRIDRRYKTVLTRNEQGGSLTKGRDIPPPLDTVAAGTDSIGYDHDPRAAVPSVSTPLGRLSITSGYGLGRHPLKDGIGFHRGVDLAARADTVRSVLDGIVLESAFDTGLGYYARIGHGEYTTIYGHLSRYFVLPDERVYCGQPIGITGGTGSATGEHLHFAVHFRGRAVDPLAFLATAFSISQRLTKR